MFDLTPTVAQSSANRDAKFGSGGHRKMNSIIREDSSSEA